MNVIYDLIENVLVIPALKMAARSVGATRSMICLGMFVLAMAKSIHWVVKNVAPKVTKFVREHVMSHPIVTFYLDEVAYSVGIILFFYKLKTTLDSYLEIRNTYKTYKRMNTQVNALKQEKKALQRSIKKLTKVEQALLGEIEALIA